MPQLPPWWRLILVGWITIGCHGFDSAAQTPEGEALVRLYSQPLKVKEPSGLALDPEGNTLWVVSDKGDLYQLDLQGGVLARFRDLGGDLEGITCNLADSTLWMADEEDNSLIQVSRSGQRLASHRLALQSKNNHGLEGLCFDGQGRLCAVTEKDPGLFIVLAADLSVERQFPLAFARDYADLAFDAPGGNFWVVSDEDQTLWLWNPERGVLRTFVVPFANPEGVAIDTVGRRLYLVSDVEHRLYVFDLPSLDTAPRPALPYR